MITMNHHPLHTNVWFAEHESVQGRNVVVGNLVYSLVLGMSVPDVSGAAIANLEVETLQHKNPVFHGDTIYAETRVLDVKESSSARSRHRHRRDEGLQPGRRRGLLLPAPGHGVEARRGTDVAASLRRDGCVASGVNPVAAAGFGKLAATYERGRPSYPDDAMALLARELGIGPGRRGSIWPPARVS